MDSFRHSVVGSASPANAVTLLATQIPEFGGSENERVRIWVQRVEKVAQVHRAPDDVILLAASGKLTKAARKWYDIQSGLTLESWINLRDALIGMFDQDTPYTSQWTKYEKSTGSVLKKVFSNTPSISWR